MTKIAFLACAETLPGGAKRRGDAFEHDLTVTALRPAFASAGLELAELDWRSPIAAFDGIDAALLGTAWDYQDHPEAFLVRLEELAARDIAVFNSPAVVRWNCDKRYLLELEKRGARIVPTLWHDGASSAEVVAAMDSFETDRVVVKRQIGAGGLGQHSFTRKRLPDADWSLDQPVMIQPFLPSILDEGEVSFVFVGGAFSHAVRKLPAAGEYRIQSLFGGSEQAHSPSSEDLSLAQDVIRALPFDELLYVRIDMVRLDDGALAVMECEMIEPYLYPEQGAELGQRIAAALVKRLD